MLCRAILTAIAISYVICVLLLSGLQKEELDANTMEKLRRHNVNIYDMNNESLRQECLLKSLNAAKDNEYYEGNEDKNDTLTIPINQQSQSDGLNAEIPKTEDATTDNYFETRPDLRSLIDELKIKDIIHREPIDSGNVKTGNVMANVQDEINMTIVDRNKEPQMEYISQPQLDSVLKFWSKFTRKPVRETEYVTVTTTTYNPPRMKEAMRTDTKGYEQSKEKEYINRIIAEYLASQKVSTTTQTIRKKRKKIDAISRKIKELLAEKAKEEEIEPIIELKNIDDALNLRALTGLTDLSGPIRINNKGNGATKKALRMSSVDKEDTNSEVPEILENERIKNISPRTTVDNPAPGMEALKYLEAFLRLNEETKTETVSTSHTETTTESTINLDNQEPHGKWNKDVRYNAERFNQTNKDLNKDPSKESTKDQVTVPADIIQKIAEKVKEIVLKDIRKTTTEAPTTITSTIATTAFRATSTNTGVSAVSFKDMKGDNRVIQTLMELFKEYKAIKETTPAPTKITSKPEKGPVRNPVIDRLLPPLISGSNPYEARPQAPNIREMRVNPYKQSLVQIPLGPADRALQALPYSPQTNNYQKNEYRVLPITIQTNSVEVPPLAIPVAKPIPLINQHIIVTSPNPFARHKEQPKPTTEQPITAKYREILSVGDERNLRVESPTYVDLAKKLRAAEDIKKEFRDSYKDRIQKLKERIKHAHEQNREKARELNLALGSDYRFSTSRLIEPSYHGGLGPKVGSGHRNPLNQQVSSHNYDAFNRPLGPGNREAFNRALDPNIQDTVNRALNMNLHQSLNRPLDQSFHESLSRPSDLNRHENYNRPLESSHRESLNRAVDLNQYMPPNRAEDPNQRDIITREVLSRLVGSNHHDVISRLVEPSQHDVINRPVDLNQQSRSHHSDAYERIEHEQMHPRFKGARFHEELERIETMPQNNYNNNKQENCCDGVAARQQMPLNKIKQRGRFDDSHFRNFLKSQQKVTDMLERILASKTKQETPSVEMP